MKVLFLDIDGVLNSIRWFDYLYDSKREMNYPLCEFDPLCVANLNSLIAEIGCQLVITSSRRLSERINDVLAEVGVRGEIVGQTPVLFNATRGAEVEAWLSEHQEVEQFAIVDDRTDFLPCQMTHFVHTNEKAGMTDADVIQLIEILNSNENDKD